eukprot:5687025-Prymnesium_polylepis.1
MTTGMQPAAMAVYRRDVTHVSPAGTRQKVAAAISSDICRRPPLSTGRKSRSAFQAQLSVAESPRPATVTMPLAEAPAELAPKP